MNLTSCNNKFIPKFALMHEHRLIFAGETGGEQSSAKPENKERTNIKEMLDDLAKEEKRLLGEKEYNSNKASILTTQICNEIKTDSNRKPQLISPQLLENLAARNDWHLSSAVASHPNTPMAVLLKLSQSGNEYIEAGLVKNPKLPANIKAKLSKEIASRRAIMAAQGKDRAFKRSKGKS